MNRHIWVIEVKTEHGWKIVGSRILRTKARVYAKFYDLKKRDVRIVKYVPEAAQ